MQASKDRRYLARRAARLERHRRKRKHATYQPWRRLTRNQREVAKRLTRGQITLVTISGWGFVASFLAFLDELGFFALLDLEGKGFKRVMIPIARLILTYQLKVLLGISSINLVPSKLFREVALLQLIGYTTTQMQAGFCQRGNLAVGPMHKNTLADAVEKLTAEELEGLLNEVAKRLASRGYFAKGQGHFALDATDLATTPRCLGTGRKTYREWQVIKEKGQKRRAVEVERWVYGFKVLIVYEVHLRLVVAAKVVEIQKHESQYTLALVRQAVKNLGEGVLRVLLIDRGFLDGQDLWVLKHALGIDFVVPAKADMRVTADAQGLGRRQADGEQVFEAERVGRHKERKRKKGQGREGAEEGSAPKGQAEPVPARVQEAGQVSVVGVAELRSYDQYGDEEHVKHANSKGFVGNALNAVVVTKWEGQAYEAGSEKVFLTSLPINKPLGVLDLYDLRSLIENTAFRELKQGWCLESYPKKTAKAIVGHVFLTLLTFTLANAFRTASGQALAERGIRRQRAEQTTNKVVVFAGDYYAIFDIEEVFILLGVTPQLCLSTDPARVRRRYCPPSVA
jgi:hypothetical protein